MNFNKYNFKNFMYLLTNIIIYDIYTLYYNIINIFIYVKTPI